MKRWRPVAGLGVCLFVSSLVGCSSPPVAEDDLAVTVINLEPEDDAVRTLYPVTIERAWVGQPLAAVPRAGVGSTKAPAASGPDRDAPPRQPLIDLHIRLTREDINPPIVDDLQLRVPYWGVTRPGQVDGAVRAHSDPIVLAFDQPGVSMALAGGPMDGSTAPGPDTLYGGQARITLAENFLHEARSFNPQPTLRQMLLLGMRGLSAQDLRAYINLAQRPGPQETMTLADARITPQWVNQFNQAGYTFDLPALLRLGKAGVPAPWAVSLRDGGYRLGPDDLLKLHKAKVPADYANAVLAAGFDEGTDALIAIHAAGVSPEYAKSMRTRRVATDAKTLIDLHKAGLTPEDVDTYEEAGYILGAPQLIVLQESGVRSAHALQFKKAGYDFSISDLLKLQRWQVPADYTLSLVSDQHEPLTADQIIDLRLRKVSPELVQSLRRAKQDAAVVSAP